MQRVLPPLRRSSSSKSNQADSRKKNNSSSLTHFKPALAFGLLLFSVATALGALSSTFNSAYDVGATASSYTASGALTVTLNFAPAPGQQLLLVNNTGAAAISGTFTGLAEGATRTATYGGNTFTFRISYVGGTGNDITLTRVAGTGQVTSSNNYLWTHLAGSTGGPGSQDGIGSSARFNSPDEVAVDVTGNIYVADYSNHTIRKITPNGVVTTIAGAAGFTGSTDGSGNAARFNSPAGIAVDVGGNIYVADRGNHTIRKVTPAGVVSTLAGDAGIRGSTDGSGSAARFYFPASVAVDSAGNVYVADSNNHTIRKVTMSGVVTTLAGSAGISGSTDGAGSIAQFKSPAGVSLDSSGNVYVADAGNHTIRKVTTSGIVSTLAGTAGISGSINGTGNAAQFYSPSSVSVDSSGNVYVTDTSNHRIRKVTASGVVITLTGNVSGSTDGTGTNASFNSPSGVAVDSSGNIYVADKSNHTIRKLTPAIVSQTFAGTASISGSVDATGSAARFNSPLGVALDTSGNIYIADTTNHTIRKVTPAGVVTTLAGSAGISGETDHWWGPGARFNSPNGVAVDKWGTVYVADTENSTIRMISGGSVTTLAGKARYFGFGNGTGSLATFYRPTGVAVDSVGNVYVADRDNHAIRKVTPTGVVSTLAGSGGTSGSTDGTGSAARFNRPTGVALDNSDNVYVADAGNHTIRKVTPGGVVTTLAGAAGYNGSADGKGSAARFSTPSGVAIDADGNIIVADKTNHTIRKVTPDGEVSTLTGAAGSSGNANGAGSIARFNSPSGVAVGSAGQVYVADSGNHTIREGAPAAEVATLAGSVLINSGRGSSDGAGSAATFYSPDGVTADSAGNVYVADSSNHTIRKVTTAGIVTTLAGSAGTSGSINGTGSAAQFNSPDGVSVDSSGNVYVADRLNHTIRKVTTAGVVSTLAGTAGTSGSINGTGSAAQFNSPDGVSVDSSGNVYVADRSNHTIRKVTMSGVVTTLAGSAGSSGKTDGSGSAARFNSPLGLAVDSNGNVYVADTGNHTIRKVTSAGVVSTLAGSAGTSGSADGAGTNARFNSPSGVAVDSVGNIIVVDRANNMIRMVTPTGIVTTLAGKALVAGYNSDYGSYGITGFTSLEDVAVSINGRIFVSNPSNNRITKGEPAGCQPILTLGSVSGLSGGAATLNGTVNPNGFITTAAFEYGTTQSYGSTASVTLTSSSSATAQNVSTKLSALSLGTLYHYRLTATNIDGTAITTNGTFTTPLISETLHAPTGQSFRYQIATTSELPVTFSAAGLPAGLTLDAATGIISGTVTAAGTYSVTTTVSNGAEQSSATLTLVVSTSALPFLNEPGVIRACIGQGLNHDFGAANSPTAAGVLGLPPGLFQYDRNDDGVNDAIGGSPIVAGYFRVTFWAENSAGRTERSAIIHVTKPAVATSSQILEGLDSRALVKDRFGNTYLGAHFYNSAVTVGGTTYTLPSYGQGNLIVKISPTGQVLWGYQLSMDGSCDFSKMAVDSAGNVIACGQLSGWVSRFEGAVVSGEELFVLKLSPAGNRTWARVQGVGGDNVSCNALAVDGSDNIWFGGFFIGSLGFSNGTTLTSSSLEGNNNGYVAGYSATGTLISPRMFGSTSVCQIYAIAANPQGPGIFVAGNFSGNVTVPGSGANPAITLTHPAGNAAQPAFIACIGGTTAGAHWAKQLPDGDIWSRRSCLTADEAGGLYLAGRYANPPPSYPLPENSIALPEIRNGGSFLMKLSASTTFGLRWIKDLPGSGLPAIAFDGGNSLYLENEGYSGSGYFDKIGYSGNTGRYLAKFNQAGEVIWVRDSTNSGINDYPLLAVDSGGNIILSALSDGTSPLSTGDQSVTGAGTGLFLLGNPPAASAGSLPVISSALTQTWVASRNSNREYTYQITGTNSPTSYWVSDLPVGVQFDETTGLIIARPNEPGIYTGTIWAMNAAGYGSATLTVTVTPDPDPQITSPATATATVGQPFSYQITATNSPTSFGAHGFERFDTMPDGLTFNASTGLIQGSPLLAGSMDFFVSASNASGADVRIVRVTVAGNPAIAPPTVESGTLNVTVGQALSYQIQAVGALRYGISYTGWGAGLNVNASTGLITGTPTVAGSYSITLKGINGGGVTSGLLQLNVSPASNVGIAAWRQQHFGSDQNSGNAADLATPDGDGISNLVKYALLMTPGQNGAQRMPLPAMAGSAGNRRLTLSFRRDPQRNDVTIVVEAQNTLGDTWVEIARSTNGADFVGDATVSETVGSDGARNVIVEDVVRNASRRFMRLRVVR